MHRSLTRVIAVLLSVFVIYPGTAAAYDERPLLVGVLESSVMGYRGNQRILGFEAELAQKVCQQLQRRCELLLQSFSKNLEDVRQGHLDMAFSSILITPERREQLLFSNRYMRSVSCYIGKPGEQPRYRPARIAVVTDSVQAAYLQQLNRPDIEILRYNAISEVYQALESGAADQVLGPAVIQLGFLSSQPEDDFDLLGKPVDHPDVAGDVAVAVHPTRPALLAEVNAALELFMTNGSYNYLNKKYFPFNIY